MSHSRFAVRRSACRPATTRSPALRLLPPSPCLPRCLAAVFFAISAALAAVPAMAQGNPGAFSSTILVDWNAGIIRAEAGLDLLAAGIRLPGGRAEAERLLEAAMPDLVRDVAMGIRLDSWRTVGDSLDDGTLGTSQFESFLDDGRRTRSSLTRDLTQLTTTYEWRLADLGALYVRHSVPIDLPMPSRYVPTRPYTGIVVYVQGSFSVHGEHRSDALRPCLFPRLYDEGMTPILERNLMEPGALRAAGAVAYATSLDDPVVEARAGGAPLRIMAAEIFGSNRTDAVIRQDDALRILGSAENRALVQAGKVVFVIDPGYTP